jgi:type II secretory pathway component PulK
VAAGGTINANTATQEELAAAFAAAGISNADRWAREVAEYRPYEADPTWARLRQELGKYNIDPTVLDQILALLTI